MLEKEEADEDLHSGYVCVVASHLVCTTQRLMCTLPGEDHTLSCYHVNMMSDSAHCLIWKIKK